MLFSAIEITAWKAAITTSGILAAAITIGAFWMKSIIEKGTQAAFDIKLEAVKAKLVRDEEIFKSELRNRDTQIEALRSGALSGMAGRQANLAKRRLEASERIWGAVTSRAKFKILCTMAQSIKMNELVEAASRNEKGVRQFAATICETLKIDDFSNLPNVTSERPFLSPVVWALYSSYATIVIHPAIQFTLAKSGIDGKILKDPKSMIDLAKAALPHYSNFLDENGASGLNFLIEDLEEKLLTAITESLEGKEADEAAVRHAKEILRLANAAQETPSGDTVPDAIRS